jgi:transposase
LNLQKSQYSLRYYMNVALTLVAGGQDARIEGRVGALLGDRDRDELQRLLDIDGFEMADEDREAQLRSLLDRLTPILDGLATLAAMRSAERRGDFRGMGIRGPARLLLDRSI